jgi:large subunit ribosomal protein L33
MAKAKSRFSENLIRLKCAVCGNINYFTRKNKKLVERKITLQKYCGHCQKRTEHKEVRK